MKKVQLLSAAILLIAMISLSHFQDKTKTISDGGVMLYENTYSGSIIMIYDQSKQ
jgi:hypothetical protein